MTNTTIEQKHTALTTFSVTVVDGSGIEVCGEPVTVTYDVAGGRRHTVTRQTGVDGEAQFVEDLAGGTSPVVLTAGGETLGPVRPRQGARLVIET